MSPNAKVTSFSRPRCLDPIDMFQFVLAHFWHNGGYAPVTSATIDVSDSLTRSTWSALIRNPSTQ
jgi:hypothetical protein